MSQKKNTEGKVPSTKVLPPTTVRWTKTQRELFTTKRNQLNADAQTVIDVLNKSSSEILGKIVDTFAEELKIDTVNENWDVEGNTMQFVKKEKKKTDGTK